MLSTIREGKPAADGTFQERWLTNAIGNIHQQVKYAMLEYAEDLHAGRLSVLGAVYDCRDDLKQGAGRLVIVNLNGETNPKKITTALELPELRTNQSQP